MPAPRAIATSLLVSALAAAAAIACSQTAPQGPLGDDPQAGDGQGQDTSATVPKTSTNAPKSGGSTKPVNNTCIGKAGFTFDDGKTCDTCMSEQDGCCQKLIACFKDDPQCAALQKCVDDCSGTGGGSGGDGGTTASGPGKTVFTTELYPSLNATCGSCHLAGTGGAPIFFGATPDATYTLFKNQGFQVGGELVNKGPHAGPPVTTAQVTLIQKWQAAEAGGTGTGTGGGGGTGTGGGGGTGTGTGTGGTDAGLTGRQCKDACKVQYAAALPKWDAYQVCITTTCKTQCQ